jgi:bacterioferritin
MKDDEKLITVLNKILVDELKSVNQNMLHSQVCDNLGYGELYEEIEKETAEELKQAEWLIKRIIFLEVWRTRQPVLSNTQNNLDDNYTNVRNVG